VQCFVVYTIVIWNASFSIAVFIFCTFVPRYAFRRFILSSSYLRRKLVWRKISIITFKRSYMVKRHIWQPVFLLPIWPYMDVSYDQLQNLRKICRSVRLLLPCTEVQRATESLNEPTVHCKLSSYSNSRKLICLPGYWEQNVNYKINFHESYMLQPSHCSRFFHSNSIALAVQIIKILTMQFCTLPCQFVATRPKYSLQLPTLRSSLNVSDQVSHPFKTTDLCIVPYNSIIKIWIATWKTQHSSKH